MSLQMVRGNLFELMWDKQRELDPEWKLSQHIHIAHGVNCQGVMGKGFAKQVRDKFPVVYDEYRELCKLDRPEPGLITSSEIVKPDVNNDEYGLIVHNLFTQRHYGSLGGAKRDWIEECVTNLEQKYKTYFSPLIIHAPKIGCGLGGLEFKDIEKIFKVSTIQWVIYDVVNPSFKFKSKTGNRYYVR